MKTQGSGSVNYYIQTCQRCGQEADSLRSSWFNTHMLCPECCQAEATHPLYAYARQEAFAKAQAGDYHFTGIGLPQDLQYHPRTP
jgi:hypothetical protein